jgi:Arrestin (or S-antigen), N-terminal domain
VVTYTSSLPLVREDRVLWTQETQPPAGTDVMQLPFEFQIPKDSPASFHSDRSRGGANISYGIEVVADRPGLFRFNRRIGRVFAVLPIATQEDVEGAFQIGQGWSGEWKSFENSRLIRKRIWGEYSRVHAEV